MVKRQKAQSILEYILVVTAVVGVIIYGAAQWIRPAVLNSLDNATEAIGKAADKLNNTTTGG